VEATSNVCQLKLVRGVGNYESGTACIMSAAVAHWRMSKGESIGTATDEMECCCPVVRAYLIRLNDSRVWDNDEQRTEMLTPLIPLLVNTRNKDLELKRAFMLADFAVRKIAPIALRFAGLEAEAAKLESLSEIVDEPTARAAVAAAARWAAASSAARWAAASSAAADAADVAAAARWAARWAAASAASAASSAAASAASSAAADAADVAADARWAASSAAAAAADSADSAAAAAAAAAADAARSMALAARSAIREQSVEIVRTLLAMKA